MKTVWHDITPEESRISNLAEEAGSLVTENMVPGVWLVNLFPIRTHLSRIPCKLPSTQSILDLVRYIPECLPGGGFHQVARVSRAMTSDLLNVPFDMVKMKKVCISVNHFAVITVA